MPQLWNDLASLTGFVHAFSGGEETAISSQAHEPRSESGLPDFDQATFAELMVFIIH